MASLFEETYANIPQGWEELFIASQAELKQISDLLDEEKKKTVIVPEQSNTFKVFKLCKPENVKVVILGQDPYHQMLSNGKPRAQGLSFSVLPSDEVPSSLQNIYKEIKNCYPDSIIPSNGDLTKWVEQGVFLLNISLTCRAHMAGSHNKYNLWMPFMDRFLKFMSGINKQTIFVLWGKEAQKLEQMIEKGFKNILKGVHPSGLSASRGFFGCGHFRIINEMLKSQGRPEIQWCQVASPKYKTLKEIYPKLHTEITRISETMKVETKTHIIDYYKSYYDNLEINLKKAFNLEEYAIYSYSKGLYEASTHKETTFDEFLEKLTI